VDRGPDQTQRFDLPSAKSFATRFVAHVVRPCTLSRDGERSVIPAIARFYPQHSADCPHFLGVPDAVELRGDELHRFPEARYSAADLERWASFQSGPDCKISLSLLSGRAVADHQLLTKDLTLCFAPQESIESVKNGAIRLARCALPSRFT